MPNMTLKDWPVGKIATKIMVFTRSTSDPLVMLLRMLHENVEVINPDDKHMLAHKYNIGILPTIIFFWKGTEIERMELEEDLK